MTATLGSKADTLARLAPLVTRSYVKPLLRFDIAAWHGSRDRWLDEAQRLAGPLLAVRSSCHREDGVQASNAGAFLSVLHVRRDDRDAIARAVDAVIASYGEASPFDQVLVQEQLEGVRLSGVAFTRDPTTLAPYSSFEYDESSGTTDTITSGRAGRRRTYVRLRGAKAPFPTPELEAVFAALEELERLVASDRLDVELAVDREGRVSIFQVRPIVVGPGIATPPPDAAFADFVDKVQRKVTKLSARHPYLHGRRSLFGVMPDWNPAEMIGLRPRALATSLYKEMITDSIWAYQRDNYGYRNLRSFPLLVSLLGVPFIDVRVDFNSFVPRGVRPELAEKLVDFYLDRLAASPSAHDKVEFDIVFSCYHPTVRRQLVALERAGFARSEVDELAGELRDLTNRIVHPERGLVHADVAKVATLPERSRRIVASDLSLVAKIYWLLEDAKRYGTLPFSGIARAAFIAMQFLSSLVTLEVLAPDERRAFLASLETVARRMTHDLVRLDRAEFLAEYGHLRPGTYDILSLRYDEAPELYLGAAPPSEPPLAARPFELSDGQRKRIDQLLADEGLELDARGLLEFCRTAIEWRERAKWIFTRSLSDALVLIEKLCRRCDLTREDASHLDVKTIQGLYSSLDALDLREVLLSDIEANRKAHEVTRGVRLPALIVSPEDVLHFHLGEDRPNFIGVGKVVAAPVEPEGAEARDLEGKLVFISSADPGWDWIFSRRIAGLVTLFGGANSHMAIRAAELGLPAVIGCGEGNWSTWRKARRLEVDCANQRVTMVG